MKKPERGDKHLKIGPCQVVPFKAGAGGIRPKQGQMKKGLGSCNHADSQRKVQGSGLKLKGYRVKVQEMEE